MMIIILLSIIGIIILLYKMKTRASDQEVKRKNNYYDKLLELQKLREKNIITEEEFEKEKEKIKP